MIDRAGDLFFAQHPDVTPKINSIIDAAFFDMSLQKGSIGDINIISGSLGSQVTLRYLKGKFKNFKQREACNQYGIEIDSNIIEPTPDEKLVASLFTNESIGLEGVFEKRGLNFYMLSNQYDLMKGNLESWGGVEYYCEQNGDSVKIEECLNNINVVAFRNPNDMLCYYLQEETLVGNSEKCKSGENLSVSNVHYWNFLIGNNLLQAHTKPFTSKKMFKAISYGSTKGEDKSNYWILKVEGDKE